MNTRLYLLLLCAFASFNSLAQLPFFNYFRDSIKPGHSISGYLDSTDAVVGKYQSSLPTQWRPALEIFSPLRFYNMDYDRNPLRFSAISHVGLRYAVGSNNTQRGGISWTQALDSNLFVQFDYERLTTAGYLRNNSMEGNRVDANLMYRSKRFASHLSMYFLGSDRSVSGGLLGDTLNPGFPLIYSEVEHPTASTFKRNFQADWLNYLSFTSDSLLKTGLFIGPNLHIETRRFTETGLIDSLYPVVNYDSTATDDNWQKSEIGGTGGYFFDTRRFGAKAGVKLNHWLYDNEIRHQDTTEASIVGDLRIAFNPFLQLTASGRFTFLGAIGESAVNGNLEWKKANLGATINAGVLNAYPMLYQRYFYGNTLDYTWTDKLLSTVTHATLNLSYRNRIAPVSIALGYRNYNKLPFFTGSSWRQDTLTSINTAFASVQAGFKFGKFFAHPRITIQQAPSNLAPAVQAWLRLGLDARWFKGKKLHNVTGIEAGYTSEFRLLDYVPNMDTYVFSASDAFYTAMPRLHFYTQFELGFFRWFIRVENIEQAFLTYTNQEVLGYPVAPLQFRVGLGWDLFN